MIKEINEELAQLHKEYMFFGLILFTESHPNVIKMLQDRIYYMALDSTSGDDICVFATMLFPANFAYPTPPPGMFGKMKPIWVEPSANLKILSWFNIDDRKSLPVLVIFSTFDDTIHWEIYPIKHEKPGRIFDSVHSALESIAELIDKHRGISKEELFKKLKWKIKKLKIFDKTKSLLNVLKDFNSLNPI